MLARLENRKEKVIGEPGGKNRMPGSVWRLSGNWQSNRNVGFSGKNGRMKRDCILYGFAV
jgi:hypothetical protein